MESRINRTREKILLQSPLVIDAKDNNHQALIVKYKEKIQSYVLENSLEYQEVSFKSVILLIKKENQIEVFIFPELARNSGILSTPLDETNMTVYLEGEKWDLATLVYNNLLYYEHENTLYLTARFKLLLDDKEINFQEITFPRKILPLTKEEILKDLQMHRDYIEEFIRKNDLGSQCKIDILIEKDSIRISTTKEEALNIFKKHIMHHYNFFSGYAHYHHLQSIAHSAIFKFFTTVYNVLGEKDHWNLTIHYADFLNCHEKIKNKILTQPSDALITVENSSGCDEKSHSISNARIMTYLSEPLLILFKEAAFRILQNRVTTEDSQEYLNRLLKKIDLAYNLLLEPQSMKEDKAKEIFILMEFIYRNDFKEYLQKENQQDEKPSLKIKYVPRYLNKSLSSSSSSFIPESLNFESKQEMFKILFPIIKKDFAETLAVISNLMELTQDKTQKIIIALMKHNMILALDWMSSSSTVSAHVDIIIDLWKGPWRQLRLDLMQGKIEPRPESREEPDNHELKTYKKIHSTSWGDLLTQLKSPVGDMAERKTKLNNMIQNLIILHPVLPGALFSDLVKAIKPNDMWIFTDTVLGQVIEKTYYEIAEIFHITLRGMRKEQAKLFLNFVPIAADVHESPNIRNRFIELFSKIVQIHPEAAYEVFLRIPIDKYAVALESLFDISSRNIETFITILLKKNYQLGELWFLVANYTKPLPEIDSLIKCASSYFDEKNTSVCQQILIKTKDVSQVREVLPHLFFIPKNIKDIFIQLLDGKESKSIDILQPLIENKLKIMETFFGKLLNSASFQIVPHGHQCVIMMMAAVFEWISFRNFCHLLKPDLFRPSDVSKLNTIKAIFMGILFNQIYDHPAQCETWVRKEFTLFNIWINELNKEDIFEEHSAKTYLQLLDNTDRLSYPIILYMLHILYMRRIEPLAPDTKILLTIADLLYEALCANHLTYRDFRCYLIYPQVTNRFLQHFAVKEEFKTDEIGKQKWKEIIEVIKEAKSIESYPPRLIDLFIDRGYDMINKKEMKSSAFFAYEAINILLKKGISVGPDYRSKLNQLFKWVEIEKAKGFCFLEGIGTPPVQQTGTVSTVLTPGPRQR